MSVLYSNLFHISASKIGVTVAAAVVILPTGNHVKLTNSTPSNRTCLVFIGERLWNQSTLKSDDAFLIHPVQSDSHFIVLTYVHNVLRFTVVSGRVKL